MKARLKVERAWMSGTMIPHPEFNVSSTCSTMILPPKLNFQDLKFNDLPSEPNVPAI